MEVSFETVSDEVIDCIDDSFASYDATASTDRGAKVCVGEREIDASEEIDEELGCEEDATAALTVVSSLVGASKVEEEDGVGESVGLFDHGQAVVKGKQKLLNFLFF